jgi:hypothetical protein
MNSDLYHINTGAKNNFNLSQPRLSIYMNGVYYMGIKAFNHLPSYIKGLLDNKKEFKNILKNYLLLNSFCSLKDFFLIVITNFNVIPMLFCNVLCILGVLLLLFYRYVDTVMIVTILIIFK